MKLIHNDRLVVGVRIYTCERSDPQGCVHGRGLIASNCAQSLNDFTSETTFQTLMKLGHNAH